jgi:hypothetical protein
LGFLVRKNTVWQPCLGIATSDVIFYWFFVCLRQEHFFQREKRLASVFKWKRFLRWLFFTWEHLQRNHFTVSKEWESKFNSRKKSHFLQFYDSPLGLSCNINCWSVTVCNARFYIN